MALLLPDEAFHSYLLRDGIRRGENAKLYNTVISKSGWWKPFSSINVPNDISTLSDENRFNLVRRTLIESDLFIRKDYDLLTYNIINNSKKFNFSSHVYCRDEYLSFAINRKIRFCSKCIEESISLHGVGYFKKSWFYKDITNCLTHNIQLTEMAKNHKNNIQNIIDVIANKGQGVSENPQIEIKNRESEDRVNLLEKISSSSDCFWDELIKFILSFVKVTFRQYEIESCDPIFKKIYKMAIKININFKKRPTVNERYLVLFMVKYFPLEFNKFVNEKSIVRDCKKLCSDGSIINYKIRMFINAKCDFCLLDSNRCLKSKIVAVLNLV